MNFIRRLNRGNFYFSSQSFQIWWLISGIEVRKTHKISAQYLKKNQSNNGVNKVSNVLCYMIQGYFYCVFTPDVRVIEPKLSLKLLHSCSKIITSITLHKTHSSVMMWKHFVYRWQMNVTAEF